MRALIASMFLALLAAPAAAGTVSYEVTVEEWTEPGASRFVSPELARAERSALAAYGPFRALFGVDVTVPAGGSVALVGANGAGKTTIVKLLCRLYEPTSGAITVDGTPLRDLDAESWRRGTAVVFQDFIRYPATLADNIAFGAVSSADDTAGLRDVVQRAGLEDLVASLQHRQHGSCHG